MIGQKYSRSISTTKVFSTSSCCPPVADLESSDVAVSYTCSAYYRGRCPIGEFQDVEAKRWRPRRFAPTMHSSPYLNQSPELDVYPWRQVYGVCTWTTWTQIGPGTTGNRPQTPRSDNRQVVCWTMGSYGSWPTPSNPLLSFSLVISGFCVFSNELELRTDAQPVEVPYLYTLNRGPWNNSHLLARQRISCA